MQQASLIATNSGTAKRVVVKVPEWLTPELRDLIAERQYTHTFKLSRAVRKMLRKRKPEPIEAWVEKNRVLSLSSKPGPWRNSLTPYLTDIMRASFFPSVQDVTLLKAPQVGGSEVGYNCIGYAAMFDPGPAMTIFPDIETAKENNRERITPMFEDAASMRELLTGRDEDKTGLKLRLQAMPWTMGWARSVSRLGNRPIRYLVLDETDKYPAVASAAEADPTSLAEARTTTFRYNKKIWRISTPTNIFGAIWLAWLGAQVRFKYLVRCPDCGGYHEMKFDNIKWPEGERDANKVRNENLAYYVCPQCGACWDDLKRDRAVKAGHWREEETGARIMDYLREYEPRSVGFHIPAWLSTFVGLSECAYWFLRGNDKSNAKRREHLKHFMNAIKAEPWEDRDVQRVEDRIWALCDEDRTKTAPVPPPINSIPRVAGLIGMVDTQDKWFKYSIVAMGWGESEESWRIRCGLSTSFSDMARILWGIKYKDPLGNVYPLKMVFWDCMGTRTKEVYKFCAKHIGKVIPIRGRDHLDSAPVVPRPVQKPYLDQLIWRVEVDTTYYKNDLSTALAVLPGDPGQFHLLRRADMPPDYAKEMCQEWYDPQKGRWIQPEGSVIDYWDCETYGRACWDFIDGPMWTPEGMDAVPDFAAAAGDQVEAAPWEEEVSSVVEPKEDGKFDTSKRPGWTRG